MKKYVKFTGKFKDLIPDGWTFQKLFARNYRQYHKTCDGEEYSQGCRIWQHLGGYLEVEDFFSNSHIIVEQVASGKISEWISETSCLLGDPTKKEKVCWLVFDREERRFIEYHSDELRKLTDRRYNFDNSLSEDEHKVWLNSYYKRYREANFMLELFDMIQDLLDKGWIEVQEDKRKY
jgi:hypothetical protein